MQNLQGLLTCKLNVMNVAEQLANRFWQKTDYSIGNPDGLFEAAKTECYKIKDINDKVVFIKYLIKLTINEYEEHERNCTTLPKEDCDDSKNYNFLLFFLNQELDEYSSEKQLQEQSIDYSARVDIDDKIDTIINELEKIKVDAETIQKGQVIIVEAFCAEFEELKSLYHLSQKNWRQNLFGKFAEMVVSGITSETISKEVVSIMKDMGKEVNELLIAN